MGDGLLVEFSSVVDAVRCAIDIQRGMSVRAAAAPDNEKIIYRIGINLGDVIVDGPRARRGTLKSSGERWVGTIFGFGR